MGQLINIGSRDQGWDRCAVRAERAVAVLQTGDNIFYSIGRFVDRFGRITLDYLEGAGVVWRGSRWVVELKTPYRVHPQWMLKYAKEHGEDAGAGEGGGKHGVAGSACRGSASDSLGNTSRPCKPTRLN